MTDRADNDLQFDHLVVGAATLEQGAAYIEAQLGVTVSGGKHPLMGTHNHPLRLGERAFLEVIATDPGAAAPNRPRWFGLDDPYVQKELERGPRLLTWVVRTSDLLGVQGNTSFSFGGAVSVTRGKLSWRFSLPDDGHLLASGMLPYLITWSTPDHPAQHLSELGCTLESLELCYPRASWLARILEEIGAAGLVRLTPLGDAAAPFLKAYIRTPTGLRTLGRRPRSDDLEIWSSFVPALS